MIRLRKAYNFLRTVCYAVKEFVILVVVEPLATLRDIGNLILGLLYQPFLAALILLAFSDWIDQIYESYKADNIDVFRVFLLVICVIIVVLVFNAIIELIYEVTGNSERFTVVFAIQRIFYNYALVGLSLFALWFAYKGESDVNLFMLGFGCIFFFCVGVTDLYDGLIYSKGKVPKLYENVKSFWNELRKSEKGEDL